MGRREALAADGVRQGRLFARTYQAFLAYGDRSRPLLDRQHERLSALLTRVLRTVPALRARGVTPGDDPFATLARLPTMTKQQIRDDYRGHFAEDIDPRDCASVVTSGTTGVPLKIVHNSEHFVHVNALALRRALEWGLPLDRKVLRPFKSEADGWLEYTVPSAGFLRYGEFGFVTDEAAIARRCLEFGPDVVFTHPSRALALRDMLAPHGVLRPRVVQTFGEQLTDAARQAISEHFQAPVRDCYGVNEASTVAAQCPEHGRYHIEGERVWVEIVDDDGNPLPDGVEGDIVVTNLFNTVMPFVRYRTGDVGALSAERCPCGREQKVLRLITGRQHGAIALPDGSRTDVLRLVKLIERFPVERLQVVQDSRESLTVLVRPAAGCTDDDLRRAADAATAALHGRLPVRLRRARPDEFTESRAGKHLNFVSLMEN
ncbi:phenylacetate--CoA ligase family protein [Kutzneria buriramensis]|uniref:Phenylacetate-CoA ligase n=1 Tax=Kutzneria buriramensis TaxID=1045776 RepID=A0A3E0H2Q5_9PSEU|nr:AMP-binding protein [Kutzneria buriramensis]REH36252.1 phenylacetate-CoA ligase [Kutzneria buriramensis]